MEVALERKKFSAREVPVLSNGPLLEDAKKLLLYTPDALTKQGAKLQRYASECKVAEALNRLGIEPLDSKTVAAYQGQKMNEAEKRGASAFVLYMHESARYNGLAKGERVIWLTTIGIVVSAVVTLAIVGNIAHRWADHQSLAVALRMYWGFLLSAYCILMYARHKDAITVSAAWRSHDICNYSSPIPEFALARAVALMKELPAAKFQIEELDVQEHGVDVQKHIPDPFLAMYYQEVKVYLDVWDEPTFEGRRTV